jgi:acetyl esterase/lipase
VVERMRRQALSMVVAFTCVGAHEMNVSSSSATTTRTAQKQHDNSQAAYLRADDRIRDLLNHPAFAGFSRLTLPWDDRDYDDTMQLRNIGALLPYHSHVNPDVVVSSLNRMIDDVTVGKTVFYDFYTKAQKRAEPTRENTGLFFFRGKKDAPFAVIAPGGGFSYVASLHEGFPYAVEISNRGYNAVVLKYRTGQGGTVATQDLAAAVSYIFRNADALGVSTTAYSLWGSSAGARMAAAIGSYGTARFGAPELPKPSAIVMAYTGHSEVGSSDPATFVVVGERDGIAPPSIMERRVALLRQAGIEVEYHKYPGLGHGFGLGTGTSAEGWVTEAVRFWEKQIKRESVTPARGR